MNIQYLTPKPTKKDGYSTSSVLIKDALQRLDIELVTNINDIVEKDADFCLIYGPPMYAELLRPNIPYGVFTMWETNTPPEDWGDNLRNAAFVANPSEWGCRAFEKRYGIEKVHHVPLAYDSSAFNFTEPPGSSDDEPFKFLVYNSGFAAVRKGFLEVVEAFKIAFTPTDDAELVIKCARPDLYGQLQKIAWEDMKRDGTNTWHNMKYISEAMDVHSLVKLTRSSDCFVFPTRGEGFGITPLEAMGVGLPCIISSWAGMSQYFDPDVHYGFSGKQSEAKYDHHDDYVGDWTIPDVDELANAMRVVYENQEEAKARGIAGTKIAAQYTYDKTAKLLMDLIKQHV